LQSFHGHASLLGKGLSSPSGRAVLEGHLPRGAGQLLLSVGLRGQNVFHQHGQPPRRGVSRHPGLRAKQAFPPQQIVDPLSQLGLGAGNHAGRNLIQSNLQQKISHNLSFFLRTA
jgi:hypothetical protein